MGTMEAVGISLAAGIWAGVVGWWFRASTLPRRWVEDARMSTHLAGTPAASTIPCSRTAWPATTSAAAATVVAAFTLERKGSLWVVPFLVVWASGLALLSLLDEETLLLPSKLIHLCAVVDVCLLVANGVATGNWSYLGKGLLCGVAAFAAFGLWALLQPNGLGLGDVRLALLVALGAGTVSPVGCIVTLACAPAVAAGVSTLPRKYGTIARSTPIALGPFLALAGITAVVASAI